MYTPRRRRSLLQRVSQRRLSVTNQRRVLIYGKLALMPFRMAASQVQPIFPYALDTLRATPLWLWAAGWASYGYALVRGTVQQVRGRADGVLVIVRGG